MHKLPRWLVILVVATRLPAQDPPLLIETVPPQMPSREAGFLTTKGRFTNQGLDVASGGVARVSGTENSPWLRLTCRLDFPEMPRAAKLLVNFELDQSLDAGLAVARSGRPTDSDAVRFTESRLVFPVTLREYSERNGVRSGEWVFEYRFGTMSCASPNGTTWQAFAGRNTPGLGPATCGGVTLQVEQGSVRIRSVRLQQGRAGASVQPQIQAFRAAAAEINQLESAGDFRTIARRLDEIRPQIDALLKQPPLHVRDRCMLGDVLGNFGSNYDSIGRFEEAGQLMEQSRRLLGETAGKVHPEYSIVLGNLSIHYSDRGDIGKAIPLARQALETDEKLLGDESEDYSTGAHNLAVLYASVGDYASAEPLYRKSLKIEKDIFGEDSPSYATSLLSLGTLYANMGENSRALPLLKRASEIRREKLGADRVEYGGSLVPLGIVHQRLGQHAESIKCLSRATAIRRRELGERHPAYADALAALGNTYLQAGRFDSAEGPLREAMRVREAVLGRQHPAFVDILNRLGTLLDRRGDPQLAASLLAEAVRRGRENLRRNSVVQSERQQRRNVELFRLHLDVRISNAFRAGAGLDDVVEDCWEWKGIVTARQRAYREIASNPALAPLFDQLRAVNAALSATTSAAPLPPKSGGESQLAAWRERRGDWEVRFANLNREREAIEEQIASASTEYRRVTSPLRVRELRQSLPPDTAFVDFVEYDHLRTQAGPQGEPLSDRRFAAFIVTRDLPVVGVSLPAASIDQAVQSFRQPFSADVLTAPMVKAATSAGALLREEMWDPIEKHLPGIRTVILSPDTSLARLPFAALPGRTAGRYLIEDYRIAHVPMAVIMRGFMDRARVRRVNTGVLVVADVTYGAAAVPAPPSSQIARSEGVPGATFRGGKDRIWSSLPGFREELNAVTQILRSRFANAPLATLSRQEATEERFLRVCANYGTLHLVTHGYFESAADAGSSESGRGPDPLIAKFSPGLLSGLVLANANLPVTEESDDGILRASEIEAASMAGVDLVVLSACETGLGASAGGEGLTGLQRAFQIAGARSVVASLWKVDDRATLELMRTFYENLWIKGQTKLDALRNAQLDLLRNPVLADGTRLRGKPVRTQQPATDTDTPKVVRTDPLFWAAWTISGDWR